MSKKLQLEEEISGKASALATLRGLTEHPGWKLWEATLESQKQVRQGEILFKPLQSTEAVFAQEFMKGEIAGLTLAHVSIFAQIEALQRDVQISQANLEKENELERQRKEYDSTSRVDGPAFGD